MAILYRAHRYAHALQTPLEGWCLTDDYEAACRYGYYVAKVEIDLDALDLKEVPGYDHNTNTTPADSLAFRQAQGVDVVCYEDETDTGMWHYTWRLASERAVNACRVISIKERE